MIYLSVAPSVFVITRTKIKTNLVMKPQIEHRGFSLRTTYEELIDFRDAEDMFVSREK